MVSCFDTDLTLAPMRVARSPSPATAATKFCASLAKFRNISSERRLVINLPSPTRFGKKRETFSSKESERKNYLSNKHREKG